MGDVRLPSEAWPVWHQLLWDCKQALPGRTGIRLLSQIQIAIPHSSYFLFTFPPLWTDVAKKMGLPFPSAPRVSYWQDRQPAFLIPTNMQLQRLNCRGVLWGGWGSPFPSMPTPRCRNPTTGWNRTFIASAHLKGREVPCWERPAKKTRNYCPHPMSIALTQRFFSRGKGSL